jgi:hypothetical protein
LLKRKRNHGKKFTNHTFSCTCREEVKVLANLLAYDELGSASFPLLGQEQKILFWRGNKTKLLEDENRRLITRAKTLNMSHWWMSFAPGQACVHLVSLRGYPPHF